MAFKPGMHQPVNDKDVDFDAVIAKMASIKPRASFPTVGWGKRYFIDATVKKKKTGNRIAVEVFAELTFGKTPTDESLGYTKDEVTMSYGVSVINYAHEPDEEGHLRAEGEIMEYQDFLNRYIVNEETRVTLERIMKTMTDLMTVSDSMLDRVNNAWGNRDPGERELFSIQYQ